MPLDRRVRDARMLATLAELKVLAAETFIRAARWLANNVRVGMETSVLGWGGAADRGQAPRPVNYLLSTFNRPVSTPTAAAVAAYDCQARSLDLAPWEAPPCAAGIRGKGRAARLLRRMLKRGISRWHPRPLEAIAAAGPVKKKPSHSRGQNRNQRRQPDYAPRNGAQGRDPHAAGSLIR
jgi:hypothetical protein